MVGELTPNDYQDVAFLPPELVFSPHFLEIVVEVKTSGPPPVLKLWQERACSLQDIFTLTNPHFELVVFFEEYKTVKTLG